MTAAGYRKHDAKGRSASSRKFNRKNRISEQFSARTISMLESPAYRVLSLSAHRVLARIEVEHAHHGGQDNGRLPVTYDQFEEYGIHRKSIAPAIRELESLGFIEVTERGRAGNREYRSPNLFRITYRPAKNFGQTDNWKLILDIEDAKAAATVARTIPGKV